MDCERDRGEVIVKRNSVSDTRHVKFSPRVKILNKEFRGGCRSCSEILLTGFEDGSTRGLDSSDTVASSSSKASCGDIVRVDSKLLPNSVGENGMPQSSTRGSNEVEEFAKECRESDNARLVEDVSPILSPSIRVVECPEELCESSKSGEAFTSGEIHETKESRSSEKLKVNGSRKDNLGRFGQSLPPTKEVEQNENLALEKAMSVCVKHGEKEILVDTRTKDSNDTSNSKHKSDGTVALTKKKKFSCKSCHCFKWPRCSFKRLLFHGCFFCEKPSNRLKYPKWAGPCFKCLYWPCLICRC